MKLIEYKLPPSIKELQKKSVFFIFDTADERVLAVMEYNRNADGSVYGYTGKAFRETDKGWMVMDKFISCWDMTSYASRYDYTLIWDTAIYMARKPDEI